MGGESCTVLKMKLMHKFAMSPSVCCLNPKLALIVGVNTHGCNAQ